MANEVKRKSCNHEWIMRQAGALWVTCRKCPAQVRIDVGETQAQWLVDAVVTVAGCGGVSISDLDWLCERVRDLLHEVERQGSPVVAA